MSNPSRVIDYPSQAKNPTAKPFKPKWRFCSAPKGGSIQENCSRSHETSLYGVKLRGGDSVFEPGLVSKHGPTGASPARGLLLPAQFLLTRISTGMPAAKPQIIRRSCVALPEESRTLRMAGPRNVLRGPVGFANSWRRLGRTSSWAGVIGEEPDRQDQRVPCGMDMRETLRVGEERTPAGKALDEVGSEAAGLVEETE